MKLHHFRHRAWQSSFFVATLVAFAAASGSAHAASANDDGNETSGGWDLSVTPVQSATIGAVALTGLFTLSLLQRRRRG
ncbi:hypothetical protein LVJ94_14330 [Pendulispora rubella]|uniref:Uncharacterized protein n=1 Tax=Pendulispora rubella TaxID=2741070 RepID=A0ABZ2LDH7_9BACT